MIKRLSYILLAMAVEAVSATGAAAQGRWLENRPMEIGRSHLSAAALAGEIYVAGGTGILEPLDNFELYDPLADHWIPQPALPGGREQFAMAASDGLIFISGGFTKEAVGRPSSEFWVYDPEVAQWRDGPDLPTARAGHVMVAYEGRLFLLGGVGARAAGVDVYEVANKTWSKASFDLSTPRAAASAVMVGSQVYLIGGVVSGTTVSNAVDVIDLKNGSRRSVASLPSPRYGVASAVLNGQIHVAGGATISPRQTHFDHFVYDPSADRWRTAPPLPTPRFATASATVEGRWYVFGGGAGAGFFAPFTAADAVESFIPQ